MARTNKYASINFNEVYGKKQPINTNPSPSPNPPATRPRYSPHGGMLVLTRPSKQQLPNQTQPQNPSQPTISSPQPILQNPTNLTQLPDLAEPLAQSQQQSPLTDPKHDFPDSISLRPLGRSPLSAQILAEKVAEIDLPEAHEISVLNRPAGKPEPFVPPHLRPGFNRQGSQDGEEPRRNQPGFRPNGRDLRNHSSLGHIRENSAGQSSQSPEQTRPKSGGYERRSPEINSNRSNSGSRSSNPWPDSKSPPNSGGGRPN